MTPREATEAIVAAMNERTRYLDFDAVPHTYRIGDKVIPSVTSLITYLKKRGDFFGTEDAERGTAVHECIEHGIPSSMVDHAHRGYVAAWEEFCSDEGYTPVAAELPVLGPGTPPLWAGTLDSIGYTESGPMLVGVKSHRATLPKKPPPEWSLQEAAYKVALVSAIETELRSAKMSQNEFAALFAVAGRCFRMPCVEVSLGPDGSYRPHRLHGEGDPCLWGWPWLAQWAQFCRGRRYRSVP